MNIMNLSTRALTGTILLGATLALSACQTETDSALADFDGRTAEEIINELEATPVAERRSDLLASVGSDELLLSSAGEELSLELPADTFYVSVAPYVNQTHDCFHHSLTTCLGELSTQPVRVTVTDESGATVLQESTTTEDNGFLGLWLPRDLNGTLTLNYGDLSHSSPISTTDGSPTCLTTARLT